MLCSTYERLIGRRGRLADRLRAWGGRRRWAAFTGKARLRDPVSQLAHDEPVSDA
jgi:hypothetical protein